MSGRRRGRREDAFGRALLGSLGVFDPIVLYGNNLGLVSSPAKARRLLRRLRPLTTDRGRILAGGMDIGTSDDPDHRAYREQNERRGRPPGQVRLRVRYRRMIGPWFDWWFASKAQLEEIVQGTGWRVARYLDGPTDRYVAVLEKD
jgi:hypothetical protein